jgi:hypothetical protein
MKIFKRAIISLLLIELSIRLFLYFAWHIPLLHPQYFLYRFYGNLSSQDSYTYKSNNANLLILGGSTLSADTLRFSYNKVNYVINFCNVPAHFGKNQPINALSLAYPANTILDCLYEYQFMGHQKFDYLLLYNGINDTRANNIAPEKFDTQYRHIEFYDDLAILQRHPEINITVLPFVFDWAQHGLQKRFWPINYLPKENLHQLRSEQGRKEFLQYGNNIKTEAVFKATLEQIKTIADKRGQKLILSSFAWYQPSDYTYENFNAKKLDYSQSLFPTELYGEPEYVIKGVNIHNALIREFAATNPDIIFVDAEKFIPKEGKYFNDICHLSDAGCALFSDSILRVMESHQSQ